MTKRTFKGLLLFMFLIFVVSGCTDAEDNLLSNSRFEVWTDLPDKWLMEGPGKVRSTETQGVELASSGLKATFLYQAVRMKSRYKGAAITLAGWVRTDVPESAAIEFSDRRGFDRQSPFHPGDGQWHLLKVTLNVPHAAETIEFRFRNFKSGTSFIREASMSVGEVTALEGDTTRGLSLDGMYTAAGLLLMLILSVSTNRYMKKRRTGTSARLVKNFLILIILSNAMLLLGRPLNALVTSILTWSAFSAVVIIFLLLRLEDRINAGLFFWPLRRPGTFFISLSMLSVLSTILFLYQGSTYLAEKAAALSYVFMILGFVAAVFSKLLTQRVERLQELKPSEEPAGSQDKRLLAQRKLRVLKGR